MCFQKEIEDICTDIIHGISERQLSFLLAEEATQHVDFCSIYSMVNDFVFVGIQALRRAQLIDTSVLSFVNSLLTLERQSPKTRTVSFPPLTVEPVSMICFFPRIGILLDRLQHKRAGLTLRIQAAMPLFSGCGIAPFYELVEFKIGAKKWSRYHYTAFILKENMGMA